MTLGCQGCSTVATSSHQAIRGATVAGTGQLVIADDHTLVLQDFRRVQQRSWGLRSKTDRLRHVWYAGQKLGILYTNHDFNTVDQYSFEAGKALRPVQLLHSQPLAMAVSVDGAYMLSSCKDPPLTYLTRLVDSQSTLLLSFPYSKTPAVVAAFHPERLDVFLLAFQDGSIAAYKGASMFERTPDRHFIDQQDCEAAALGHLRNILRTTATKDGDVSQTFTGAAFLPRHRCRVIVIGSDCRCRLIDLDRGTILRTWRVHDCPVAVAVSRATFVGDSSGHLTSSQVVIAVILEPSTVHLYSLIGQRLGVYELPGMKPKVLSLQWFTSDMPVALSTHSQQGPSMRLPVLSQWRQMPAVFRSSAAAPTHIARSCSAARRQPSIPSQAVRAERVRSTSKTKPGHILSWLKSISSDPSNASTSDGRSETAPPTKTRILKASAQSFGTTKPPDLSHAELGSEDSRIETVRPAAMAPGHWGQRRRAAYGMPEPQDRR